MLYRLVAGAGLAYTAVLLSDEVCFAAPDAKLPTTVSGRASCFLLPASCFLLLLVCFMLFYDDFRFSVVPVPYPGSQSCQKHDWSPNHKTECKLLSGASAVFTPELLQSGGWAWLAAPCPVRPSYIQCSEMGPLRAGFVAAVGFDCLLEKPR